LQFTPGQELVPLHVAENRPTPELIVEQLLEPAHVSAQTPAVSHDTPPVHVFCSMHVSVQLAA
jgi:hypothetical protein